MSVDVFMFTVFLFLHQGSLVIFFSFFVNKSHENAKTNNELIPLTSICLCSQNLLYRSVFLCAVELPYSSNAHTIEVICSRRRDMMSQSKSMNNR